MYRPGSARLLPVHIVQDGIESDLYWRLCNIRIRETIYWTSPESQSSPLVNIGEDSWMESNLSKVSSVPRHQSLDWRILHMYHKQFLSWQTRD